MSNINPHLKERVNQTVHQLRRIRHASFSTALGEPDLVKIFSDIGTLTQLSSKYIVDYFQKGRWNKSPDWDSFLWELHDLYPLETLTRREVDSPKHWLPILRNSYRNDPRLPLVRLQTENGLPLYLIEEMEKSGARFFAPLSSDLVIASIAVECVKRAGYTQYSLEPVIPDDISTLSSRILLPPWHQTLTEGQPTAVLVDALPHGTTRPAIRRFLQGKYPLSEIF